MKMRKGEMSGTVGGGHSLSPWEFLAENLWQGYTYPASHAQINMQTSDSLEVWTRSVGNSRMMLMPVHHFSNRPNSHESAEAAYGPRLKSYWPENWLWLRFHVCCTYLSTMVVTLTVRWTHAWYTQVRDDIFILANRLCWGRQQTADIWSNISSRMKQTSKL